MYLYGGNFVVKNKKMYLVALILTCVVCVYISSKLMDEKGPVDVGSIYINSTANL